MLHTRLHMGRVVRSGRAFALAVAVAGCGPSGADLETEVVEVLRTKPQVVDLGREIAGSWDRLCLAPPYTTQKRLDQLLGFSWRRGAAGTGIDMLDRATLLVFTDSAKVAGYAMVPRSEGDFSTAAGNCVPREDAVFTFEERPDGWRQAQPLTVP